MGLFSNKIIKVIDKIGNMFSKKYKVKVYLSNGQTITLCGVKDWSFDVSGNDLNHIHMFCKTRVPYIKLSEVIAIIVE